MPDWQPNWEDVAFDHGRAAEAAAACREAARTVDHVRSGMATAAPGALADWRGELATDFGEEEPVVRSDLGQVEEDLEALAKRIETAAVEARAEQRRREDSSERWRDEKQQEEARENAMGRHTAE